MRTITIKIPDSLDLSEREIVITLAAHMYQDARLSLGQAADLAGLTKSTFGEVLGMYGVSLFNYPVSDLANDIRNA